MKTKLTTIKIITLTALLGMLVAFTGCSTIVRGVNQDVSFDSVPAGATVVVANKMTSYTVKATTPTVLRLSRSGRYTVTFTKDGYATVGKELNPTLAGAGVGASAGNLVIGGIIGLSVDMFSGAMYDLAPNPMVAQLTAIKAEEGIAPVESTPPVDTGPPPVVASN